MTDLPQLRRHNHFGMKRKKINNEKTNGLYVHYSRSAVFALILMIILSILVAINYHVYEFGAILGFIFYFNLSLNIRSLFLSDHGLIVKYPFRPIKRTVNIPYRNVYKIYPGKGTYLDGSILILVHTKNGKKKKLVFNFPGDHKWKRIISFLKLKSKSIRFNS